MIVLGQYKNMNRKSSITGGSAISSLKCARKKQALTSGNQIREFDVIFPYLLVFTRTEHLENLNYFKSFWIHHRT